MLVISLKDGNSVELDLGDKIKWLGTDGIVRSFATVTERINPRNVHEMIFSALPTEEIAFTDSEDNEAFRVKRRQISSVDIVSEEEQVQEPA